MQQLLLLSAFYTITKSEFALAYEAHNAENISIDVTGTIQICQVYNWQVNHNSPVIYGSNMNERVVMINRTWVNSIMFWLDRANEVVNLFINLVVL